MQGIFHVSITLLKLFKASVYSGNLCLGGKNVLIIIRYHWPAVQFKKKKKSSGLHRRELMDTQAIFTS